MSDIVLQDYSHDRDCPKCRFMPGTTQYMRGYHGDLCETGREVAIFRDSMSNPAGDFWEYFRRRSQKPDPEMDEQMAVYEAHLQDVRVMIEAVPEHFDRACPNCKYEWAEAVVHE